MKVVDHSSPGQAAVHRCQERIRRRTDSRNIQHIFPTHPFQNRYIAPNGCNGHLDKMLYRARSRQTLPIRPIWQKLDGEPAPLHLVNNRRLPLKDAIALQEIWLHLRTERVKQLNDSPLHTVQIRCNEWDEDFGHACGGLHRPKFRRLPQFVILHSACHWYMRRSISSGAPAAFREQPQGGSQIALSDQKLLLSEQQPPALCTAQNSPIGSTDAMR